MSTRFWCAYQKNLTVSTVARAITSLRCCTLQVGSISTNQRLSPYPVRPRCGAHPLVICYSRLCCVYLAPCIPVALHLQAGVVGAEGEKACPANASRFLSSQARSLSLLFFVRDHCCVRRHPHPAPPGITSSKRLPSQARMVGTT